MNILTKIFSAIVGFFTSVWHKVHAEFEEVAPIAITVGSAVRDALKSKAAIVVTDLIPGEIDDTIRQKVVDILDKVLPELTGLQTGNATAVINDVIANVTFSSDRARDLFIHNLVAMIITDLSDGKITLSEVLALLETKYQFSQQAAA